MALNLEFTFDEKTYRHYLNGIMTVLHCHHYLCLTSKMAEDFADLEGPRILRETAEDTISPFFQRYYQQNEITKIEEKLLVGAEYYSVMGMGKMQIQASTTGGAVRLSRSHVDQGWIKKWGKHDKHINHFTCGFIAAIFAAAFSKPARSFKVTETGSIVTGGEQSEFAVEFGGTGA
jgi:hypothetical protein